MRSIEFNGSNQLLPTKSGNMPVFIGANGEIISRWRFTFKELLKIIWSRAIFVSQYPKSVAFPQTEVKFRTLTEEEKEAIKDEVVKKEAEEHERAKKQAVIDARNKRNPARLRKLREVAKEQGMIRLINGAKSE